MWGAHEVDGRIAAKNAVKIRAALRQSVDARQIYDRYQSTQPAVSDNNTQDRARARAWALLNINMNNEATRAALLRLYAEAWVTGEAAALEAIGEEEELAKAVKNKIDWSKWQPGDAASALLLDPPKAFQDLIESTGALIRGLDRTGYELIGTALADSIRAGYAPKRAAKLIQDAVGSPARALTIAVTESSRVMNNAALLRYKDAGLDKVVWSTVLGGGTSVACEKCAQNDGQVVQIGSSFNSGNTQPPAHPHCRCNLRPVLPDYSDVNNTAGSVDMAPMQGASARVNYRDAASKADLDEWSRFQIKDKAFRAFAIGKPGVSRFSDEVSPAYKALRSYKGAGYAAFNKYLRTGEIAPRSGTAENIMNYVNLIDEAIDKAPVLDIDMLSYRALSGDKVNETFNSLSAGDIWQDKGFSSTTMNLSVAEKFNDFGDDQWVVTVQNPQGTKGIMLDGLINDTGGLEAEWLLPRNSNFEVVEIDKTTRKMTVKVTP